MFCHEVQLELTVYFTFYVFPYINQVFTNPSFVVPYLNLFAKLGVLNRNLQAFIAGYYQWKKGRQLREYEPKFFDFMCFEPLMKAEKLFYQVGLSASETIDTINQNMANVERLARFIAAYIYSLVVDNHGLLMSKEFVDSLELENLRFDPAAMRQQCSGFAMASAKEIHLAETAADFIMQFRSSRTDSSDEGQGQEVQAAAASRAGSAQ